MVIFMQQARFARLSKCKDYPFEVLLHQMSKEIKKVDLPTLILSLDHIVNFLRKAPSNISCGLQQRKLFFQILSQKMDPLQKYMEFIAPSFKKLIQRQNYILNQKLNKLINVPQMIKGIPEHPIDKELIRILDSILEKQKNKGSIPAQFLCRPQLFILENRMKTNYQKMLDQIELRDEEQKKICQKINDFLSYDGDYQDKTCLSCCKYFLGSQDSIYNCYHSFYEVETLELEDANLLGPEQNKIKAYMCSFLNKPQGGIILIGCEKSGTSVYAKGVRLTEKQKESVQQKIQNYFGKFEPKINRNTEVKINFVPVYADKYFQMDYQHKNGLYVIRITLTPSLNKIYYYKVSNQICIIEVRKNNQTVALQEAEIYDQILKKYEIKKKDDRRKRNKHGYKFCLNNQILCHYGTPCEEPNRGNLITDDEIREEEFKKDVETIQYKEKIEKGPLVKQKIEENIEEIQEKQRKTEQKKKNYSLIVGDREAISEYKNFLEGDEKTKGRFNVTRMFKDKGFKLTKNTWVMDHYQKFEVMKKVIAKNDIKMKSGKKVHLISAGQYLEVMGGLYENQVHYLQQQLYQNLNTQVVGWATTNANDPMLKNFSWVIKFDSVEAAIFSYFLLDHYKKDVKFIRGSRYFNEAPVTH